MTCGTGAMVGVVAAGMERGGEGGTGLLEVVEIVAVGDGTIGRGPPSVACGSGSMIGMPPADALGAAIGRETCVFDALVAITWRAGGSLFTSSAREVPHPTAETAETAATARSAAAVGKANVRNEAATSARRGEDASREACVTIGAGESLRRMIRWYRWW